MTVAVLPASYARRRESADVGRLAVWAIAMFACALLALIAVSALAPDSPELDLTTIASGG
jgi:hypothetical protein